MCTLCTDVTWTFIFIIQKCTQCWSLFKKELQEAKNLTLLVTLSRGTRAGSVIAMDDIKVIIIHHLKHKFSLIFDSQVQWLPVLAHEAAKEVQHQQHLFLPELPNEETTEAGNVTISSTTEETSGSGENEGSATEGSSGEEEVRLEPDRSTNHELN